MNLPGHLQGIICLGLFGLFFLFAPLLSYVAEFGIRPVEDQEIWGQFGNFIGGTTNPVFAFLAFIGVLWTILINRDDIKNQQVKNDKDDLFKVVEIIHSECIDLLQVGQYNVGAFSAPMNASTKLVIFLKKKDVVLGNPENERNWNIVKEKFHDEMTDLCTKLTVLRRILLEFEQLSKTYFVSEYYKVFYSRYTEKLYQLGLLSLSVNEFYKERHLRYFEQQDA